jgi:DHH family
MNLILIDYCKRFEQTNKPENYERPVFDEFFTNLDVDKHWEKLPYLHNIQNFCLRLLLAQLRGDKICIYSDYDTDAVTATAAMYHGLIDLGFDPSNIEFYAPDRFTEGYGMNTQAVDTLSQKFDLIISVDCGINSWPEAEIVNKNNDTANTLSGGKGVHQCDLIITDHHHLTDQIPDCVAVVNCRMSEVYSNRPNELKEINQRLINQIEEIVTATTVSRQVTKIEVNKLPLAKGLAAQADWGYKSDATPKNITTKTLQNLQSWLTATRIEPQEYPTNPNKFLSQSVTGVGVAWFSLVWYAYFLEYLEL